MVEDNSKKQNFEFQDDIILIKRNSSSHFQNAQRQHIIRIPLITKFFVVGLFFFFFLLYKVQHQTNIQKTCVVDQYHQLTFQANRRMYNGWDNTIIGVGQFLMDGWVMFIVFFWVCKYKNMRIPLAIGFYFSFRAFMLNMQKFPFPQNIVWHAISIPALVVPYGHTRDFYYSGHTGTLTLFLLQFLQIKSKYLAVACGVSLLYIVNMLTISRIHYSIDVIGALVFAPFWYLFVKKYLTFLDKLFSIPFEIFQTIRSCLCGNNQTDIQAGNQIVQQISNANNINNTFKQRDTAQKQNNQKLDQFSQFQMKTPKQRNDAQLNEQNKEQESPSYKNQIDFQAEQAI